MWVLKSASENNKVLYLFGKKQFTVGRTVTSDLTIQNDQSISREHAIIEITSDGVRIQDVGSKYGTFVKDGILNKIKLKEKTPEIINDMDNIRFGQLTSIWTLTKQEFVTCTSTVKGKDLIQLQLEINKIGGTIKSNWDETCKYLTMLVVSPTLKVLHALTSCAHIVKPDFWSACAIAAQNGSEFPDPKDFIPTTGELILNTKEVSFFPDVQRQKLFSNKKILFFSTKQCQMYTDILKKAGGNPLVISKTKMTKNMICQDDIIVIQYNGDGLTQNSEQGSQIESIKLYMKKKNYRIIPESEICLAVAFCSLQKYCNPKINLGFLPETQELSQNESEVPQILAEETEEFKKETSLNKPKVIIDESLISSLDSNCTEKDSSGPRKRTWLFSEESTAKKMCIENIKITPENSFTDKNKETENFLDLKELDIENEQHKVNKKLSFLKPAKLSNKRLHPNIDKSDLFDIISEDKHEHVAPTPKKAKTAVTVNIEGQKVYQKAVETRSSNPFYDIKPAFWKQCDATKIETKPTDDEEYLGTTVVVSLKLAIKSISHANISNNQTDNTVVRNFKKFKKVYPLHMQKSTISHKSMTITKEDNSNIDVNLNESEDESAVRIMENLNRKTKLKKSRKRV